MEGKISREGNFFINRAGDLKPQYCHNSDLPCGDGCPKFGEPYRTHIIGRNGETIEGWALRLCEGDQLFFTEFSDSRKH